MIRQQPTWFLALVALLTVALDQGTKRLIVTNLAPNESWQPLDWLAPIVKITHVHNSGAAFGMFPGGGLIFTIVGVVVVGAILYYFHQLPPGEWWVRVALGMQLGGAIGNLTDRFRQGYVTDFINFAYFPVFNVADSSIVVGVAILIVVMILEERREAQRILAEEALVVVESDPLAGVERPDSFTR